MRSFMFALVLTFLPVSAMAAPPAELGRVTAFLHKTFPGRQWDEGPLELASDSLRRSYPGLRFFAVWSNEPMPPGAPPPPGLHPTWSERIEAFQRTHVTAVVRLDRRGRLSLYKDVNDGLRRARTENDRRLTCAAVFSLAAGTRAPPGLVPPENVTVESAQTGWSCRFRQEPYFGGDADFTRGRCTSVSKASYAPMPPSAPPRPRE